MASSQSHWRLHSSHGYLQTCTRPDSSNSGVDGADDLWPHPLWHNHCQLLSPRWVKNHFLKRGMTTDGFHALWDGPTSTHTHVNLVGYRRKKIPQNKRTRSWEDGMLGDNMWSYFIVCTHKNVKNKGKIKDGWRAIESTPHIAPPLCHTLATGQQGTRGGCGFKEGRRGPKEMKTYDMKVKRGLYGQGRGSAREAGRAKLRERKEGSITCVWICRNETHLHANFKIQSKRGKTTTKTKLLVNK